MDISEINKLSTSERILLIQQIWGTLAPENIEIPEYQKAEVLRRLQRYNEGESRSCLQSEISLLHSTSL
jgi:putative addiction module component (TIGR02574 family)